MFNLKCQNFIISVREQLKELTKQYEKSENDLKALQSVGQVGDKVWKYFAVFKQLEKVMHLFSFSDCRWST